MTRLSWTQRMQYRFLLIPGTRNALKRQRRDYDWMYRNPVWGPGRIDPFNPVKFGMLKLPVDTTIGNSDMVPIWNMKARQCMALHWDGLSTSLREVVLSSALGDGASRKSIQLQNLERIEQWLMTVHRHRIRTTSTRRWRGKVGQFTTSSARSVTRLAVSGRDRSSRSKRSERIVIDWIMWTPASPVAYNKFAQGYPWAFTAFRKTNGYVAVPLDGVWLRAPYLHNGAVASLDELFEPPEKRRQTFYRGYDVYDPARVGFISEGGAAQRVGILYDTRQPGNSNAGHTYGVDLTPAQKKALIEFLKML
jgi:RoxA-like, cytochrome c-like